MYQVPFDFTFCDQITSYIRQPALLLMNCQWSVVSRYFWLSNLNKMLYYICGSQMTIID